MRFIKNFLAFIFIVGVLGYTGWNIYRFYLGPCGEVLEYRIGSFDSKFGVSEDNFKSIILEAEKSWEKILGRELFVYNPEAKFKINLIYDERQQTTDAKQKTEFGLTKAEEAFKKIDLEFIAAKSVYGTRVGIYERDLKLFEVRQKEYASKVDFWNKKGGAPKGEYGSLETEQRYLNREASRLNNEVIVINKMTEDLNSLLSQRNLAAEEYNKTAQNYNKKYGHGLEFNQAEYNGESINIYQFGGKKDLVLALAHEFGHSIGMGHIENPRSIMYYVTGINTENSLIPSEEDLVELRRVCKL